MKTLYCEYNRGFVVELTEQDGKCFVNLPEFENKQEVKIEKDGNREYIVFDNTPFYLDDVLIGADNDITKIIGKNERLALFSDIEKLFYSIALKQKEGYSEEYYQKEFNRVQGMLTAALILGAISTEEFSAYNRKLRITAYGREAED